MDLFQSILTGIKKKLDSENDQCEKIARIASEVLGMTVVATMVVYKKSNIQLKLPPTARMALNLKRPELLQALQREGIENISIH